MNFFKYLFIVSFAFAWFCARSVHAADTDIYSVQFSADGNYVVTGGAANLGTDHAGTFTGGIKIWRTADGKLVKSLGRQVHLQTLFGEDYGQVGGHVWGIHSYKDIVLNGSYPEGKIILLPSSLGRIDKQSAMHVPDFIGGYLKVDAKAGDSQLQRINLPVAAAKSSGCADIPQAYDYIGPVVPSGNGRYAAVVVNTCTTVPGSGAGKDAPTYRYNSALYVMNLSTLRVTKSFPHIDAGVYALGISNNGRRVAFVGSERFAVMDVSTGKLHTIEKYEDPYFQIPRQFSSLYFSNDGNKLVSLRYIYDIKSGKETELAWKNKDIDSKHRISSVKVAPDLGYFVLVMPKRSIITFGDDGLPRAYGKADKVVIMNAKTGIETNLPITDNMTDGKRCVADISPDSTKVAVACAAGLIKVFDAHSGKVLWQKHNVGYLKGTDGKHLIQARNDGNLPVPAKLMTIAALNW